jgi:hypothetical protein
MPEECNPNDDAKVLRPEQYAVWDGHPCGACTEDMKLEKHMKELENSIEKIHIKRRTPRIGMNQNHD